MSDGTDKLNKIANKCLDMDKACHTYLLGTEKIFVMNCYEFQFLFISYINLVTKSSSFFSGKI